jgi:hypothetical protein
VAKKTHDLVVKVGTYQKDGETKGRYKNVGMMMENDEGKQFLMIDPLFNFAAVQRQDGKDMVIVSMFEPKGKDATAQGAPENWQE